MAAADRDEQIDVWGTPPQIDWRTSQRIVTLDSLAAVLPIRLELARIEVPAGQHLICRRVWQLMSIAFSEGLPTPQARQVQDPAYLALLLAAGAAPLWRLAWRRFDDDRDYPTFPEDVPLADADAPPDPIEGWSSEASGNFLFPWGVNAEQRIQVPGQGALSLYVDLNEEAADSISCVGGLLQGETRTIIPTPEFRAWFGRR